MNQTDAPRVERPSLPFTFKNAFDDQKFAEQLSLGDARLLDSTGILLAPETRDLVRSRVKLYVDQMEGRSGPHKVWDTTLGYSLRVIVTLLCKSRPVVA